MLILYYYDAQNLIVKRAEIADPNLLQFPSHDISKKMLLFLPQCDDNPLF